MKLDFALKQDSSVVSIEMNGIDSAQVFSVFPLLRNCSQSLQRYRKHQAWVVRKVDIAIHRINHYPATIALFVLLTLIHWMAIYPVDSVMQPLNNCGQKVTTLHRHCRSWQSFPIAIIGKSFLSE